MSYLIALTLLTAACVEGHSFDNPILTDYNYPDALKVNDTYYLVTSVADISDGLFPILTSTDLINWTPAGFAFDKSHLPVWAWISTAISPEIHQIESHFVLYFSACAQNGSYYYVGTASAQHPLGPYTSFDWPILALPNEHSRYPSLINDEGNLYLLWSNFTYGIYARQLFPNGLILSSTQTTTLLTPDLEWETDAVYYPWYIRRGSFHYLLYSGGCHGVGVARSPHALGPYEKRPDPIIVPNIEYDCIRDVSVVKDLHDENDVIVFNAAITDTDSWVVLMASLGWDAEDWPIIEK